MTTDEPRVPDVEPRGVLADLALPPEPWWRRWWPPRAALAPATARRMPAGRAVLAFVTVVAASAGAGAMWMFGSTGRPASGFGAGIDASALPMATRSPARPSTTSTGPASPPAPGTSQPADGGGWAAIAGAVARPGLYRITADTRVSSLIAAAGGMAHDADADRVNLAALVRDGERVYVPRHGEPGAPAVVAGAGGPVSAGPSAGPGPGSGGGGTASPSEPIDLNSASADELDRLPGVGPATATAIIQHRTTSGRFTTVEDLADVRGIGPSRLEQIRPLVVVR